MQLFEAYRMRGHQLADLDPLGLVRPETPKELDPARYGLSAQDRDTRFRGHRHRGSYQHDAGRDHRAPRADLSGHHRRRTGPHYVTGRASLVADPLREGGGGSSGERRREAADPAGADRGGGYRALSAHPLCGPETFLAGRRREPDPAALGSGPACRHQGVEEIVIGMAHRGRINVLVNIMGKAPGELFSEFEGSYDHSARPVPGTSNTTWASRRTCARPAATYTWCWRSTHRIWRSSIRWSRARRGPGRVPRRREGDEVMPLLIHGDAAFAGQGVVMETLQMSQTRGFGPAAPCISSPTTRSALPPATAGRAVHAVLQRRGQDGRSADLPRQR